MAVTVKDLRYRTKEVLLQVQRGEKPIITHRGHPVAQIIPLQPKQLKRFKNIGYGMWSKRKDMEDVIQWLSVQREPRPKP